MFGTSFKSILAAAVVASTASLGTAGVANAGSSFSLHIGNGYHGGYYAPRRHAPRIHRSHNRHGKRCGPRRALNKAWRMGINQPHIARVNGRKIVVAGYNHGYRAKVVFKRGSRNCRVIKTRGLY